MFIRLKNRAMFVKDSESNHEIAKYIGDNWVQVVPRCDDTEFMICIVPGKHAPLSWYYVNSSELEAFEVSHTDVSPTLIPLPGVTIQEVRTLVFAKDTVITRENAQQYIDLIKSL